MAKPVVVGRCRCAGGSAPGLWEGGARARCPSLAGTPLPWEKGALLDPGWRWARGPRYGKGGPVALVARILAPATDRRFLWAGRQDPAFSGEFKQRGSYMHSKCSLALNLGAHRGEQGAPCSRRCVHYGPRGPEAGLPPILTHLRTQLATHPLAPHSHSLWPVYKHLDAHIRHIALPSPALQFLARCGRLTWPLGWHQLPLALSTATPVVTLPVTPAPTQGQNQ